jgi:SAM-dependent methyltransferase
MQAEIFDQRLENGSYDAVLAFNILHVPGHTRKVIRRIDDLLKPGGLLISLTPCLGEEKKQFLSILPGWPLLLLNALGLFPPLRFYSITQVKKLTTDSKFQIPESACRTDGHVVCFCTARKVQSF